VWVQRLYGIAGRGITSFDKRKPALQGRFLQGRFASGMLARSGTCAGWVVPSVAVAVLLL